VKVQERRLSEYRTGLAEVRGSHRLAAKTPVSESAGAEWSGHSIPSLGYCHKSRD
jgi:hypothetical protein